MNLSCKNNTIIMETFLYGKTENQRNQSINDNHIENENIMNNFSESVKKNEDLIHALQNEYKSDVILNKQKKETVFNKKKLSNISNDIDTVKRQVEISENETLRKNNFIFQLKIIFIFLILSVIPAYLMKNNKLTQTQGLTVLGSMCVILLFILFKNFLNHRFNNPNDFNIQLWNNPDIEDIVSRQTQGLTQSQLLQSKLNNMPPLQKLEFLLTEKKNTAVKNQNYTLAGIYNAQLKQITTALASGDSYGGIGTSNQDILQVIDKLNSEEHQNRVHKIQELDNQAKEIQQNINNQKTQIQNKIIQQEQIESNNSELQDYINNLQKKIIFEESQLSLLNKQKLQYSSGGDIKKKDMLNDLNKFKAIGQ